MIFTLTTETPLNTVFNLILAPSLINIPSYISRRKALLNMQN